MKPIFRVNFFDLPKVNLNFVNIGTDGSIFVEACPHLFKIKKNGEVSAIHSDYEIEYLDCMSSADGIWVSSGNQTQESTGIKSQLLDESSFISVSRSLYGFGCAKNIDSQNFVGIVAESYITRAKSIFLGGGSRVVLEKSVEKTCDIECVDEVVIVAGASAEGQNNGVVVFDRQLNELWRKNSVLERISGAPPIVCGDAVFWPQGRGRDEKNARFFDLELLDKLTGEQRWLRRLSVPPMYMTLYEDVVYWVAGAWASDEFLSNIHRLDLKTGEDLPPLAMQPYARNGSALFGNALVNDKYIVCCSGEAMRIVIFDRKSLEHVQTIDCPDTYQPTAAAGVWYGDTLYFRAMPVAGDTWMAWSAIGVLSPYEDGKIFSPCVRPLYSIECIAVPAEKKPLHEYVITLQETMKTPELIRWCHILVAELLAIKGEAYTNQKTTMDKQFNGVVHLRIPQDGLDEDANAALKKMVKYIERSFSFRPYRGGGNKIQIEYV